MDKKEMLDSVYRNNEEYARKYDSVDMLKKIINSMDLIDRKFFVENEHIYSDEALSIGNKQTISQPTTVARMLLLSRLKPKLDVLEIGSGSGWNASLITDLVKPGKVVSTERIRNLYDNAKHNFNKMIDATNLKLKAEFLYRDVFNDKINMKFDRIIATAGANKEIIYKLREFSGNILKDRGLLVYPTIEFLGQGALELWEKDNVMKRVARDEGYAFVPLIKGIE